MRRMKRIMNSPSHTFARVTRIAMSCALLVATAAIAACKPTLEGQAVEPAKTLPTFSVTRVDGSVFTTGPSGDALTVLFFGYTHCPDICPTTLADWARVHGQLGADTARVRFVFVSIDPERDTPMLAQQYASQYRRAFIGLAPAPATTTQMVNAFGVAIIPEAAPAAPATVGPRADAHAHGATQLIGHSSQAFLLDTQGRMIALYPPGTRWQSLLADLKALL